MAASVVALVGVFASMLSHLPRSLPFPTLPPTAVLRLDLLLARCESDPRIGLHLESFGMRGPQVGQFFRAVSQGTDLRSTTDDIPFLVWRDCELKDGRPQIGCVEQEKGSEMMACSRVSLSELSFHLISVHPSSRR